MAPSDKATAEVVTEVREALRDLEAEAELHVKRTAEAVARVERQLRRLEGPGS